MSSVPFAENRHRVARRPAVAAGGLAAALVAALLVAGPARGQGADVVFTDVALEAGFQDRLTHGRALVAADWDGDGWVDFFIGNPGEPTVFDDDSFIMWNQGPDGDGVVHFTKGQVLHKGEIAFTGSAVDYDNDGDKDLFVGIGGQEGIGLDYLWRNDGGVFTDVSGEAGVRGALSPPGYPVPAATSSGTWADYDNDGDLDLYVAVRRHLDTLDLPSNFGQRNSLFRNDGDGTFTDVTRQAGVNSAAGSMTAAWGDFDDDGWMDLFFPNHTPVGFELYRNSQDGTFERVAIDPDSVDFGTRASWASSVADFDNDGRLDILSFGRGVAGIPDSHALLMNLGDWSFSNEARSSGLAPEGEPVPTVMGTAIGDYDANGYPDVFMGNGGPLFGEKDRLYRNSPSASEAGILFEETTSLIDYPAPVDPDCINPYGAPQSRDAGWVDHYDMLPGQPSDSTSFDTSQVDRFDFSDDEVCEPSYPYRGHGTVFVDYDKDGDLDLIMVKGGTAIIAPDVPSTEPNRLYRNDGGNSKNWLILEPEGSVGNRDAIGTTIRVRSSQGGTEPRHLFHFWQGNTGFSTNGPWEIYFGLGDDDTVEEVRLEWPSGAVSTLTDVAVNQRLEVTEPKLWASDFNDGTAAGWTPVSGTWAPLHDTYGHDGDGIGVSVHEDGGLTDFTVVGKLIYISGSEKIGLLGRVSPDGETYYGAILGDGEAQIFKSVDGVMTPLGSPVAIEPMSKGKAYIVRLELDGSWITMSVDRGDEVSVIDSEIASGAVGLAANGGRVAFDNVAVY